MINFKQLISKSLVQQCYKPFSQARLRNFFEVDPIFPDAHDPDRHLDIKRFSFHEVISKEEKQKKRFYEHAIAIANRKIEERVRQRREALQKIKKTNPKQERQETLRLLGQSIVEDPEFKLPYGFGFDDYIGQLKEKNLSSANEAFMVNLNHLFSKLEYVSDIELVEFHREAIIESTKKDFEERARGIILRHVVNEIKKQRENKSATNLGKLVQNSELLEKALSSPELSDELISQLRASIDAKSINTASENLANDAITRRIQVNREIRKKHKEEEMEDQFKEALAEKASAYEANMEFNEMDWMNPKEYDELVGRMSDKEFNSYQIMNEIKENYLKKKSALIKEIYFEQPAPQEEETRVAREIESEEEFEEEKEKEKEKDKDEFDFEEVQEDLEDVEEKLLAKKEFDKFARKFLGDQEVEDLERKLNLQARKAPTFSEVYDDLNRILENAPVSLKKKIAADQESENTHFKPQFTNLSINPTEFFYGNVSELLKPVVPNYLKEELNFVRDTIDGFGYTGERSLPGDLKFPTKEKAQPTVPHFNPNATFDVTELNPELEKEIELFRHVRKEPFFRHTLQNELRYYSDRMNDHFAAIYAGIALDRHRDNEFREFDLPEKEKIPEAIRKEVKLEATKYHGKSFGSGKRKTSVALAIVKDGTGLVTINNKTFVDYFGQPSMRQLVVEPMMVSGYSFSLDLKLFIWGGGMHAQAEAAQLALARALAKFNPELKKVMRQNGLMIRDKRVVERKKVGLYKARKKYPYIRR